MIGACLTVLFFVAMLVAVVRFEVASFRRQKRFNETVAKIDTVRETLVRTRATPPGAQPTQELRTMGSGSV